MIAGKKVGAFLLSLGYPLAIFSLPGELLRAILTILADASHINGHTDAVGGFGGGGGGVDTSQTNAYVSLSVPAD